MKHPIRVGVIASALAALTGLVPIALHDAPGAAAEGTPTTTQSATQPAPHSATRRSQDLPSTCFWFGPYVKDNPGFNFAYPDTGAAYWTTDMALPAGARVVLRGTYAHARYQSFSAYRSNGDELDGRNDNQIAPDQGSRNPFLPNARRTGSAHRSFTVKVVDKAAPATGERRRPNTLYAGSADSARQILLMRVYVSDKGRDLLGGVGFPKPELHLADGSVLTGSKMCRALDINEQKVPVPSVDPEQYAALRDQDGAPAGFPAQSNPVFRAYYNKPLRVQCLYSLDPEVDCNPATPPVRSGGLYSNIDNNYIWLYASRTFGDVLVLHGKLPTTPKTYHRDRRMKPAQLRYWSACQNESLLTTQVEGCLYDEQVPLDKHRNYVIVTSLSGDRPANATARCGVGYLPWPTDGDGGGHLDDSYISVRNMLPAESFHHAVQDTRVPGDEAEVLGRYLPRAEYMSTEGFEARGCH